MKKPYKKGIEINISVEVGNKRKPVKITILLGSVVAVLLIIREVVKFLN